MDRNIKLGLIISGAVVILGLVIWGVCVLMKNYGIRQRKKLKKEFYDLIVKNSDDAVKKFAEKKGDEMLTDHQVTEIANALQTIEITEKYVKGAKVGAAKCVNEKADKEKISAADEVKAKDEALNKLPNEIKNHAKMIVKKVIVKAFQEKLANDCRIAAKSAAGAQIQEFVEKGSSDAETVKIAISNYANKAAVEKAEELCKKSNYTIDMKTVEAEAKKALENMKGTIRKNVVHAALKEVAKGTT